MNTYANGRLTSTEAASLASDIIRGNWKLCNQRRPARSQTFAYHLYRLSLSFRDTKGESDYCLAAESIFNAVITHTNFLDHGIETREWNAVSFLLRLCRYHKQWQQAPDSWDGSDITTLPASSNNNPLGKLDSVALQKMRSLMRHLIGHYPMPGFWDSVWFQKLPSDYRHVDWYVHLSTGGSASTIPDLPVKLTRKAVHWMMEAPPHSSILGAMRRGQLKAQGISEQRIETIINTRLAGDFANDDLWLPLVRCFDTNPDFEDHLLLIDYLHRRRTLVRHGENYRIKGKTLASLTREMDSFYSEHPEYAVPESVPQTRSRRKRRKVHNIGTNKDYQSWEEADQATETTYLIIEIRKSYQLVSEGRRMGHCVGSYLGKCLNQQASIWSLRSRTGEDWETHVTIEVNPRTNTIIQARKSRNYSPTKDDWIRIRKWAAINSFKIPGENG